MAEFIQDNLRVFVVPVDIFHVEGLTTYEKMVFMVLRSFANPHKAEAFPSYATIARLGSMTRRHAINCVASLIEKGLLTKEIRLDVTKDRKIRNTSNLYTIQNPKIVNTVHQGSEYSSPPVVNTVHQGSEYSSPENNHLTNQFITNQFNNNNKDKKSISQNVSSEKEVALNNTLSVVVDLLQNQEIEINQATVTKWSKLADESTILAATQEALDRPEVKNVIGYVSKILENGYVAPQKATGLENSKVRSQNETRIKKSELPEWIVKQMNGQVEDDEPISEEVQQELDNLLKQLGQKD